MLTLQETLIFTNNGLRLRKGVLISVYAFARKSNLLMVAICHAGTLLKKVLCL